MRTQARFQFLTDYVQQNRFKTEIVLQPLIGDAGMRRYFRCELGILMDDETGNAPIFAALSQRFSALPVPRIYAADLENGFLLLEDFGDNWLFNELQKYPDEPMMRALKLLSHWQKYAPSHPLRPYDFKELTRELGIFVEWFLPFVKVQNTEHITAELNLLAKEMDRYQSVCVHRDYHSRNLMNTRHKKNHRQNIGILDYQDAVRGAPAYDVISLTRDCYVDYSREDSSRWEELFRQKAHSTIDAEIWQRLCNICALQRHLKVLGLFVRLHQRDGKSGYLQYLPRVLQYAKDESAALNLCALNELLVQCVLPK